MSSSDLESHDGDFIGDEEDFKEIITEAIDEFGFILAERIECHHCGYTEICFHPFAESVECSDCGLRNASGFAIYPDVEEYTLDEETP